MNCSCGSRDCAWCDFQGGEVRFNAVGCPCSGCGKVFGPDDDIAGHLTREHGWKTFRLTYTAGGNGEPQRR